MTVPDRFLPRFDDDDPEIPEPVGPEPREPGDNRTLSSPIDELETRLFTQRKVLVFCAITDKVGVTSPVGCWPWLATPISRSMSTSTRPVVTSRVATPFTT